MNAMISVRRVLLFILFVVFPICFANPMVNIPCHFQGGCVPPGNAACAKTVYDAASKQPTSEFGKRALSTLTYPERSPRLIKRHAQIADQLSQLSPVLNDRSQLLDFMVGGYKLIWHKVQVIVNSATAYDRHHRIYDKLLQSVEQRDSSTDDFAELGGNVATIALTYGSLNLRVEGLPHEHLARREVIHQLALQMLSFCTVGIVLGAYQVAVISAKAVTWVTLLTIEAGPIPELIGL